MNMKRLTLCLLSTCLALIPALSPGAWADMADDLRIIGVPAESVDLLDTALVITIDGSLAEGDTLLKRYGGIVFTVIDSVLAGWPAVGICVDIPGSRLRLTGAETAEIITKLADGWSDDRLASWILNHTRVFHFVEP